jgi:hypothetical protein
VIATCTEIAARAAGIPGGKTSRETDLIREEMVVKPIPGCRVRVDGSWKRLENESTPTRVFDQFFETKGWRDLPEFSADGHDGTVYGFYLADAACLVRGEWDGGSDDEPDAPRDDAYKVTVLCGNRSAFVRPQ